MSKKDIIARIFDAAILRQKIVLGVVDIRRNYDFMGLMIKGELIFIFKSDDFAFDYYDDNKELDTEEAIKIVNKYWRKRDFPVKYEKT